MHVLAVQLDIAWENKPRNFAAVERLLGERDIPRGALILLPEMFATGFSMNVAGIAEGDLAPAETFLAKLARTHRAHVLGGVVRRGPDGRGRNIAAAYGPNGQPAVRYAKLHPFSYAGETEHYGAGSRLVDWEIEGARVVPTICYDLRFPELYRVAVCRGAEVFCVIANWPAAREAHWLALLRARAIENQAYVVGVNRCGSDPKLGYTGRSEMISPRGEILADAGEAEGVLQATLDLPALRAYRQEFPVLRDMRREFAEGCRGLWSTSDLGKRA
ncbi:MAG: nitrilase-related carbon-nitrogen hydrolase [Planctomycetota bacterium]